MLLKILKRRKAFGIAIASVLLILPNNLFSQQGKKVNELVSTFSIVASDPETGEVGVAVASRFFSVGSVVPWAKADVGAVATQSFANTSFGWRGLELMEKGAEPEEIVNILLRTDDNPSQRQFGIVSADGKSATYTGENCLPWAGGRNGKNYAVQGNILTGEDVVIAMEESFINTKGTLADRMFAALTAGNGKGGDSRGKQSAALIVFKTGAGYGGYNDRAIDIRVDDHAEPFDELGRILNIAQMNYAWNEGWTLFMNKKYTEALPHIERAVKLDPDYPELLYDAAVIRLAAGQKENAVDAIIEALKLNPNLKKSALGDNDLKGLIDNQRFVNFLNTLK
ncbi:MAG: DUF1028 domain-containing protein [Melioribacteraceae bacterium]|nr:MAG: DUF1028 domain-containing protein [Melioribacteraceae bacterium]